MIEPVADTARTALPHSVSSSAPSLARLVIPHVSLVVSDVWLAVVPVVNCCLCGLCVGLYADLLGWQGMHAMFYVLWVCSQPR